MDRFIASVNYAFLKHSTVQVEEWIWTNGGRERGGLLRCRIVERRPNPFLFVTMNKIQENQSAHKSSKAPEDWGAKGVVTLLPRRGSDMFILIHSNSNQKPLKRYLSINGLLLIEYYKIWLNDYNPIGQRLWNKDFAYSNLTSTIGKS
ncbi:hypothetical protein BpHYR1_026311 [Brachionus plicatilis]|uniref:Uncharacterized protein n=1 Tax=Brachionus plicatilis TaxID=10195 RepID=A0A3M7RNI3_BRAPC|nr:hypothetical protein BpHYR1_026311 [Brachionus plicatilis]